jgi:hypothetical protein
MGGSLEAPMILLAAFGTHASARIRKQRCKQHKSITMTWVSAYQHGNTWVPKAQYLETGLLSIHGHLHWLLAFI